MAASMENLRKMRAGNSSFSSYNPGVIGNRPGQAPNMNGTQRAQSQTYMNNYNMMPSSTAAEDDDFIRSFKNMAPFGPTTQASPNISTQATAAAGNAPGQQMPYLHNGQIFFSQGQYYPQQGPYGLQSSSSMYAPNNTAMMNHHAFNGYAQPQFASEHSPPSWQSSRMPSSNMPSLVTPRRSSGGSSNDQDIPGTPFTQFTNYGNGVPVFDHSPNSLYAWSTPSPSQARFFNKPQPQAQIPLHLQILCQEEPAIPKAVPAPFSPTKPLDRRLENPNGITNVYIRGLQPNTTDEMLYKLAKRFGDIESSKAIIDMNSGLCKGFGFVKYYNFKDAEDCIRGFHFCGYETSFARESFYSQLKKLADQEATNLYISNLPIEYNEHDLGAIFDGLDVCSKRILRNPDGSGRGVGFARFASHEVCEQVINDFNNHAVTSTAGETFNIQIRYADTPEQKALKQQTTAARQYRSAEYESQTTQNPSSFMARLTGNSGYEPYASTGQVGPDQANGYAASNGAHDRYGGAHGNVNGTPAMTNVSGHASHAAHVTGSRSDDGVHDDEQTLHASVSGLPADDDTVKVKIESGATDLMT